MEEPRRCPNPDCRSDRVTPSRGNNGQFQVVCMDCGARGRYSMLRGEAINLWNLMPRGITLGVNEWT